MENGTREAYIRLFKVLMFWGIILVTLGMTLGFTLYTPETIPGGSAEYPLIELLEIANTQKFIDFVIIGMPEFLIRGRMPNMWYNLGAALLMIGVCFYFIDIKKMNNNFTKMFQYYGTKSLNLFLIHYVFLSLFFWQFNVIIFFIVYFGYVGFLGFSMCLWMELLNGLGSPEWIVAQIGRIGQKK
jgi:peptidoglycan/LPS O-acetylase OafA/YrhL